MFDVLPHSFFAGQRGICPTCGAALDLSARQQHCGYCGGESVLERRLVRVGDEPQYTGAGEPDKETRTHQTRWLLEEFGKAGLLPVTCPGCGAQFEADANQRTVTCSHCNTQSRLERRLKHLGPETLDKPQRRNHADFMLQRRGKSPLKWDVQTEQLCWRILNEPDADKQAALAHNLYESWSYTNATLAYFLPWMLDHAARKQGLVAEYVHGAVGKLLCNEDQRLWAPTLDACAQFAFNVRGPVSLLHELGLGKAICVKLLIDVAEYAWGQGAAQYACHAAFAVSTLIDRNFDEHPFIGEVMLYRLYYLSGPVLGWALDKIGSGMGGYLFKDAGKLIRFVDDLANERPEIADAAVAPMRHLPTHTAGDYLSRLQLVESLKSRATRNAAILSLFAPDEAGVAAAVPALVALMDSEDTRDAAVKALARLIGGKDGAAIDKLVDQRGESLPERLRVEYMWKFPKTTKLKRENVKEWQPRPEPPPPADVVAAKAAWDKAGRAALDTRDLQREAMRAQKERVRNLDLPIFDHPRDEPPTEPEAAPAARPTSSPATRPGDASQSDEISASLALPAKADSVTAQIDAATRRYLASMEKFQQEMQSLAARGGDFTAGPEYPKMMERMQKAITDFQAECERIHKGL
ncbi:MAG: hypothetical protein IT462_14975 [Planctomycetes bacterium]|nr:hypothetical protein [Planctomycetota bacterium]